MKAVFKTLLAACLAALVFGAGGCATRPPASASDPFSELEKIYDTELAALVPRYFKDYPAIPRQHAVAMEQYARTTRPKGEFVAWMTKGAEAEFARARTDIAYRESAEFKGELEARLKRAKQMAVVMFAGRFDVYRRKVALPDALTRDLFPLVRGRDEDECIAWITAEVPVATYRQKPLPRLGSEEGDRIFAFRSPELYWQQGLGQQGTMHVRGKEIIGFQFLPPN